MFTLTRLLVRDDWAWSSIDYDDLTVGDLRDYPRAILSATNDSDVTVDIYPRQNRAIFAMADTDTNLATWLATVDEDDMVTVDNLESLADVNVARWHDLFDFGINIARGNSNYSPTATIPDGGETDILYQTDYDDDDERNSEDFQSNSLACVNGIWHPTLYQDNYIYILGAYSLIKSYEKCYAGVYDFTELGGLEVVDITEDNITQLTLTNDDQDFYRTRWVVDTGVDLADVTPLVIIDGFMYTPDSSQIKVVSKTEITIFLDQFKIIDRALRHKRPNRSWIDYADADEVGFDISTYDPQALLEDDFTFIALIQNPNVGLLREPMVSSQVHNTFWHYRIPRGVVFYEDGSMAMADLVDYNQKYAAYVGMKNIMPLYQTEIPLPAIQDMDVYTEQGYNRGYRRFQRAITLDIYSPS